MSILNAWVGDDRALVAVDTAIHTRPGGCEVASADKLIAFPAAKLVVAGIGDLSVLNMLLSFIHGAPDGVDVLRHSLGPQCEHALKHVQSYRASAGVIAPPDGWEVVAVGWSNERKRMEGYAWTQMAGDSSFSMRPIEPWRIGPNAGWASTPDAPTTVESMQSIAHDQVAFYKRNLPDAAFGGRLIVAELTRASISIREAGVLTAEEGAIDLHA